MRSGCAKQLGRAARYPIQFLIEALTLSLLGGVLGIALGLFLAGVGTRLLQRVSSMHTHKCNSSSAAGSGHFSRGRVRFWAVSGDPRRTA